MEGVISKIDAMTMEPDQRQMEMNPQESEIMKLPDEVLETIFLMLPKPDVFNVALVCRRFLNITRRSSFCRIVKIENRSGILDEQFVNSVLKQKMAKVKKVYPRASFEFVCKVANVTNDWQVYPAVMGFSWMQRFVPFAKDIVKLTLYINVTDKDDFKNLIKFENLEALDLDLDLPLGVVFGEEADDWNKLSPKLSVLRIKQEFSNLGHSIVKFIDLMCHKLRNLKEISIEVGVTEDITKDFPRTPTEDEDKFPMLTQIKIELFADDEEKAMKNFKNYLIAKCPKVEKPIEMEMEMSEDYNYPKYSFESK